MVSKIANLAPEIKAKGGKIKIAKLEKVIRSNPKAMALLTGNSKIKGGSKKSSYQSLLGFGFLESRYQLGSNLWSSSVADRRHCH